MFLPGLILFVLCRSTCVISGAVNNSFGYSLCEGLSYRFDGYTYKYVLHTSTKLWTHCSFPNPFVDHQLCGRPKINGRHFMCDPDHLVQSENSRVLKVERRANNHTFVEFAGKAFATNAFFVSWLLHISIGKHYNFISDNLNCVWRRSLDCDLSAIDNMSVNIDTHLKELQRKTTTVCINTNGESESFTVAIAIIDRILIPDLQSPNLCSNECGRLEPYLDLKERYPSSTEQDEIMRNFADNLRQEWSLGSCDNDVIILYCKEFNKVHVSAGLKASYYLTGSIATKLQDTFINYINAEGFQAGLENGLLHMIDSLRVTLRGFTLGHAILTALVSTLICFGVGLYLYLFVRKVDSDVWGDRYPWALCDWLIQIVTGIWLVKGMVLLMAGLSHHEKGKGLLWTLGAAFAGMLICFLLYVVSSLE